MITQLHSAAIGPRVSSALWRLPLCSPLVGRGKATTLFTTSFNQLNAVARHESFLHRIGGGI